MLVNWNSTYICKCHIQSWDGVIGSPNPFLTFLYTTSASNWLFIHISIGIVNMISSNYSISFTNYYQYYFKLISWSWLRNSNHQQSILFILSEENFSSYFIWKHTRNTERFFPILLILTEKHLFVVCLAIKIFNEFLYRKW